MDFFTVSTFRETLSNLTKKPRDGYMTVVKDICNNLQKMNDDILRNTNDRVKQYPKYRIVKLRLPNTGQHLSRPDGFRLIYMVSLVSDAVVLLRVYPKRGPQKAIDLVDEEYTRLTTEVITESKAQILHKVDVDNHLAVLSVTATLPSSSNHDTNGSAKAE